MQAIIHKINISQNLMTINRLKLQIMTHVEHLQEIMMAIHVCVNSEQLCMCEKLHDFIISGSISVSLLVHCHSTCTETQSPD